MIATGSLAGKYEYKFEKEVNHKHGGTDVYGYQNDSGQGSFPITDQNLTIQVVNENLTDGDKFESMAKDIMAGGFDPEAIETMTKQLENMMGAGQRSFSVRVGIQFIGDWQGIMNGEEYAERRHRSYGTIVDRDDVYKVKIPLVNSPLFELKGTYMRGKKGNDQLQASYQESRTLPSTQEGCPGRTITNNSSFSLSRKQVK